MINKVGTVQEDFVTHSELRDMQYRVLEMEYTFKGTSLIKANSDIFNNKKQKSSTLAGTATVAGPKAPPISQYNNKEAPIATSATGDVDIVVTTATTGMTARKTDIASYNFFGKKQTSTVDGFGTVAL